MAMYEEYLRQHCNETEHNKDWREWEDIKAVWNDVQRIAPLEIPAGQDWCKGELTRIRERKEKKRDEQLQLAEFMGTAGDKVYFITVNYPDTHTTFEWMEELAQNIKAKEFIKRMEWTHEYYTAEGHHPHTHFVATLTKQLKPSKIAQFIYETKGVKKYCGGLNFVQIEKDTSRSWTDRMDYLKGEKQDSKLAFVEKDKLWRSTHFQ